MKRRLILGVTMLAVFGAGAGIVWAQGRPNFSGEWVLNVKKSTMATQGVESGTVRIDHKEPAFGFQRRFVTKNGPSEARYDLTTDDKEKVRTSGNVTRRSRMYWEGEELVLDEKGEMSGGTATNVVRYRLENGGAVLVARETFNGPKLKYANVWVFDRK